MRVQLFQIMELVIEIKSSSSITILNSKEIQPIGGYFNKDKLWFWSLVSVGEESND